MLDTMKKRRLFVLVVLLALIAVQVPVLAPDSIAAYTLTIVLIILLFLAGWVIADYIRDWIAKGE